MLLALDADMQEKALKIGEMVRSYDCPVRILSLGNKTDVGEMSKAEFESARSQALFLSSEDSLLRRINAINSGSKF